MHYIQSMDLQVIRDMGQQNILKQSKSMDPARSIAEHLLRILWSEMAYGTKASGENLWA